MKYIISKDDTEIIHITNIKQFAKFEIVPLLKTQVTTRVEGPDTGFEKPENSTTNMSISVSKFSYLMINLIDF